MAQRLLYMLIEEDDRELSSRSLLAAIAIECGFNVVFVPQWTVWQNWEAMPQGLMFFKGNNKAQAVQMREAKAHGHIVASIEEEALGISDCREVLRCFDERIARYCDLFLANGLFEADCIGREFPSVTDRISVTGNPRTDLLREEFAGDLRTQADAICAEHGEFMLVNTNFSTINPRGDDALGGFSLTLIESLDTLAVMGEHSEFQRAVRLVIDNVAFNRNVNVSSTTSERCN